MKINNMTLVTYDNILAAYTEKHLPQKISYAITRNIIAIEKELEVYKRSLSKIVEAYKDYFVKDDNGNIKNLSVGIPEVDVEHMDDYIKEVDDLLSIELDVELYKIDDNDFNYEDSERYDAMSAKDIIALQTILCDKNTSDVKE